MSKKIALEGTLFSKDKTAETAICAHRVGQDNEKIPACRVISILGLQGREGLKIPRCFPVGTGSFLRGVARQSKRLDGGGA